MRRILYYMLISTGILFGTTAQTMAQTEVSADTLKSQYTKCVFALPPFRAVINPRLQLPQKLGEDRLKGRINAICETDSMGNIIEIRMQKIIVKDIYSGNTIIYHTFYGGEVGWKEKDKLPEEVIPYFEWWYENALEVTNVNKANREKLPGVILDPPVRDTNYVLAIYLL